jgi:precorrin-6B methylase 2
MKTNPDFTSALGRAELTSVYDRVIVVMTRESKWRGKLLNAVAPHDDEIVVDLGSGTGSMAIMLARAAPKAYIYAVDPDPEVQAIAADKAQNAGVVVKQVVALGGDQIAALPYGQVDKVVTSLVSHQCATEAKKALLANAFVLLRLGGALLVADYGAQTTLLMQFLFNQVRSLDGYENTKPNKDGMIHAMISDAGFVQVSERWNVQTPTGSITLWTAQKPSA